MATRNGVRGYITTADANFTTGSGNVGQLHTHTAGGFSVLSVGPILPGNIPTPIPVAANEGDVFRVTFDMFVQSPRTQTGNVSMNWNANGATVGNTAWAQFDGASAGEVIPVSVEFTVDAGQTSLADLAPQLTMNWTSGDVALNTAFAQIDNFQFTQITAIPEPSSLAVFGLLGGLVTLRRRK